MLAATVSAAWLLLPVSAVESGSLRLDASSTEVVVAGDAPRCVLFAAQEATNFLSRAFGAAVPLVRKPTPWRKSVILGDCTWSRSAGIDTGGFERDEFAIKVLPGEGRVYIAGKDDPKSNPRWAIAVGGYPRVEASTLFGVYEFLERFFGCRFYFPGEFGEIVPHADAVRIPGGDYGRKPVFTVRYVYLSGDGRGFLSATNAWGRYSEKALNWMRLRMETQLTPCCHGINSFRYPERFGVSHPEYFQLKPDGTRCTNVTINGVRDYRVGHLCFSSAITNVIYSDVKERMLSGERYVDVMPQDGFGPCQCAECRRRFRYDAPYAPASEYIWGWCAGLGRRLAAEGVPGMLTMMAYSKYRRVPDVDLPTNILVMVAEPGPWQKAQPEAFKSANDEVKAWARKVGRKVWVWTYPQKHNASYLPDIPQMTPRAWGEYYKNLQPWIFGSFAESASDKWFYNYLNYYMFSRVAWDADADIDAIIDEHHRLMFGAAAREMDEFYRTLERKWLHGIMDNVDDTPLGPVARVPPMLKIWREIYSPEFLGECERLLASAKEKLPPGSEEARRLAFVKSQLFDPLKAAGDAYLDGILVEREMARRSRRAGSARKVELGRPAKTYSSEFLPSPNVPGAQMLKCTNASGMAQWNLDLKPDTLYRVSYFIKLDDVFKLKDWKGPFGGATVEFHDGSRSERHPYPYYEDGTFDWLHRSFTVKTPPKDKMTETPYVMPRMLHCSGTAFFDGIQIEEVDAGEKP